MFKRLAVLFASLIVLPVVASLAPSFKDAQPVDAQECLHGYTYTEVFDSGTKRVFDDRSFGPQLKQSFCAPSGYVFTASISEEAVDEIIAQMYYAGWNPAGDVTLYYKYESFGTTFNAGDYGPLRFAPDATKEEIIPTLKNHMIDATQDRLILEMEEIAVPTDISLSFEVAFAINDPNYRYNFFKCAFRSEIIHVEPFDLTDFIFFHAYRYINTPDKMGRFVLYAEPVKGFFYEAPYYNKYGFHTLTTYEAFDPENAEIGTFADYKLSLIAFDSVSLGVFDMKAMNPSLLINFPDEPIPVKVKLEFTDENNVQYVYYSREVVLQDPNVHIVIDNQEDRNSIQKGTTHLFSISIDDYDSSVIIEYEASIIAKPCRLLDHELGVNIYDGKLPDKGQKGRYYYLASEEEIAIHNQGKDDELIDKPAEGTYYIYDEEASSFIEYEGEVIIDSTYDQVEDGASNYDYENLSSAVKSLPFAGKWRYDCTVFSYSSTDQYRYIDDQQIIEVVDPGVTEDYIILDVNDDINLIAGTGDIIIHPQVSSYNPAVKYYYDYQISRAGVINVIENEDGSYTIQPINAGLVTLTLTCESAVFSKIEKTINIRVLDFIYDLAMIEVPDEFHFAGKDLNFAVNVRGFTKFLNLNVEWKVVNKKEIALPKEQVVVHNNATMTLVNPDSDDYTITASFDGIELNKLTVQVRYVDMDSFLRINIWWIVLITFLFVVLVIFLRVMLRKSKTTVEHIERVYQVFCQCLSDDTLTKEELKRIKNEISRCLRRSEDLNIDAFNQYEKASRYLRKSLMDARVLFKNFDSFSIEERSVRTDQLDKDLSKALNVAKEIESAKNLVEKAHANANRKNFEALDDEGKKKKDK